MDTTQNTDGRVGRVVGLLTWARGAGFRITELEVDGVRLKVDDLRTESPVVAKGPKPRNVHEAFALANGIPIPADPPADDEDDGLEDGA